MTEMRRITVSLPEELERQLARQKMTGRFAPQSYSEMVRCLLWAGLRETRRERCEGRGRL